MSIWAVWLGDGVAFSTDGDSVKARNIARDGRVSIVPERGTQSVIYEGVASQLDEARKPEFFAAYQEVWGIDVSGMEGSPIFFIRPTRVFGFVDEDDGFPLNATRWEF